jgi:MYND finger
MEDVECWLQRLDSVEREFFEQIYQLLKKDEFAVSDCNNHVVVLQYVPDSEQTVRLFRVTETSFSNTPNLDKTTWSEYLCFALCVSAWIFMKLKRFEKAIEYLESARLLCNRGDEEFITALVDNLEQCNKALSDRVFARSMISEFRQCNNPACGRIQKRKELPLCSCRKVHYCGNQCQTADWTAHKLSCLYKK